jgi:hypothetical protein
VSNISRFVIVAALMTMVAATASEPDEKGRYETYKATILKDPGLIRFYTFEEGRGDDVSNHVLIDPSQTAVSGGTLGSLSIQHYSVYGSLGDHREPEGGIPASWTRGRWPWKSALTSALDKGTLPWLVTKIYRSGITGVEFAEGGTLSGWIRIHENAVPEESARILTLGDGWGSGFILSYKKAPYLPNGALHFSVGASGKETSRVRLAAQSFPQGSWHYFAVTFDDKTVKLYLDGELKAQQASTGKIVPTTYNDFPLVGPFYENNTPTRFGSFLMIAHNVALEGKVTSRFDVGELAIYKRVLSEQEIQAQELAGRPAMKEAEQLVAYRDLVTQKEMVDQIRMDIPVDTGGYFRIKEPIAATVEIPVGTGLKGRFKAVFELETLFGKPVEKLERTVTVGKPLTENILPPECGVYYLDMALFDDDGKLVKRLARKYGLGIVPPAPQKLTVHNPVAFWADRDEQFHYDAPIRRLNYRNDGGAYFLTNYERYKRLVPDLRAYVWFYSKISLKPEDRALNEKMFLDAAQVLKGKNVFGVELTSEPHGFDPKAYVEMLRVASKALRAEMPDLLFFPPGAAPPSIPEIADILKHGGLDYVDGVSYHPYSSNPIGTFLWDNPTDRLKKVLALYPQKKLTLWNTECGINSLPRIKGRPMTRKDAHAARFGSATLYGHQFFPYFISLRPEEEAAALQCHGILLDLLNGYKIYTICQNPNIDGLPSLRGVAVTALAGQVLNKQTAVTRLPLSGVENMCLLIKNMDTSTTAAIFSMKSATLNFKVRANARFQTMDMLGNYGTVQANSAGLITVKSGKAPLYIFNVPADLQEVVPLRLAAPEVLPENRLLKGELTVTNPFATPLVGTLSAPEIRGASISLAKTAVKLAPGASETIAIELRAEFLKRRPYLLGVELKDAKGTLVSTAQTIFQSQGVVQMVPRLKAPIRLDGDDQEWRNVPAVVCDDADSVVHGKPNYAEVWVPQWINREDLSFSLKTAWQKGEGIFFLLKVRDNALVPAPDDKVGLAFRYDCLEFFFDSRPHAQQGTTISPGADQAVVVPQIGDRAAPCKLWYAQKERSHLNLTCVGRKTADGYLIEGKVTPNEKSDFKVRAGSQFRMDFLLDDTDRLDPKWMRKSAMALHGKFTNYNNSNIWGRYELSLERK